MQGRGELVGAREMGMSPVLVTWHLEKVPERIPVLARDCDAVVRYPGDVIELLKVL